LELFWFLFSIFSKQIEPGDDKMKARKQKHYIAFLKTKKTAPSIKILGAEGEL
jgi:hypothetical protein